MIYVLVIKSESCKEKQQKLIMFCLTDNIQALIVFCHHNHTYILVKKNSYKI